MAVGARTWPTPNSPGRITAASDTMLGGESIPFLPRGEETPCRICLKPLRKTL
jgi:hypothetical protein